MSADKTDSRLLGITAYHSSDTMATEGHAFVKQLLMSDLRDFLRTPTMGCLRVVVAQLLSYQDSHLMGPRRKAWEPPKREETKSA